jgi:hypothetical protein
MRVVFSQPFGRADLFEFAGYVHVQGRAAPPLDGEQDRWQLAVRAVTF